MVLNLIHVHGNLFSDSDVTIDKGACDRFSDNAANGYMRQI